MNGFVGRSMPHDLPIARLSYDDVRERAAAFLARYHHPGDIPVPIEDIIDLHWGIDIVPLPGMLGASDTDAYLTSDMTTIYVDEYVYQTIQNRYRFTLAHEVAHAVLHQKVFRELSFDDLESWRRAYEAISEEDHGWLEFQANAFAGLVLVPPAHLAEQFNDAVRTAAQHNVSLAGASDVARRMIAGDLARRFFVSTAVIERRIEKDGLWANCK